MEKEREGCASSRPSYAYWATKSEKCRSMRPVNVWCMTERMLFVLNMLLDRQPLDILSHKLHVSMENSLTRCECCGWRTSKNTVALDEQRITKSAHERKKLPHASEGAQLRDEKDVSIGFSSVT